MKRFIDGENSNQSTLLPEYPEDDISEDNSVRIIEAIIDWTWQLLAFGLSSHKLLALLLKTRAGCSGIVLELFDLRLSFPARTRWY